MRKQIIDMVVRWTTSSEMDVIKPLENSASKSQFSKERIDKDRIG